MMVLEIRRCRLCYESGEELKLKAGQRFDSALVAGFMMLYKLAINLVRYYYRC